MSNENPSFIFKKSVCPYNFLKDVTANMGIDCRERIVQIINLGVVVNRPLQKKLNRYAYRIL